MFSVALIHLPVPESIPLINLVKMVFDTTILFIDMPDEIFRRIASFCYPPEVYHLLLTSKRFRDRSTLLKCVDQQRDSSIANTLIYKSLLNSLERSLRGGRIMFQSQCRIVDSFAELARTLPPSSVAMSGSITVQALLGEVWPESDLDIYTSR